MKSKNSKNNSCDFCKKSFSTDDSLIKHTCEKKRRWLERDNKTNRIAFMAFERFFQIHYPSKTKKEYKEFINSRYYTSFINFSRHVSSLSNIETTLYIDYIIKNQIPLSDWSKIYVYESYVKNIIVKESIDDAFIRSLKIIQEWSKDNNQNWKEYFKIIDKNYAKSLLRSGKISPWIIFILDGENLLSRFNEQDYLEIDFLLDLNYWNKRIAINKNRINELKQIVGM